MIDSRPLSNVFFWSDWEWKRSKGGCCRADDDDEEGLREDRMEDFLAVFSFFFLEVLEEDMTLFFLSKMVR